MSAQFKSDLIDIAGIIVHQTERAVLFNDGDREVWLPLSHVELGLIGPGRSVTATMPEWLAQEKELI